MAESKPTVVTSDSPDPANVLPDRHVDSKDDLDGHLKMVRKRFEVMQTGWSHIHAAGVEDDKFLGGSQWDDQVRREREEDGRPVHTYNLLLTYCHNIVNQVRQNWPQLKVKPVDTMRGTSPKISNVQGTEDYAIADVYMGIIKNIEHQSRAKHAYITGVEGSTQRGFGFFRLMPVYPRNDTFHQELEIQRVMNAYSVLVDPTCEEADFSDMQDGFVFTSISREAFSRKWPDARATTFESVVQGTTYQDWFDSDNIRLAEYMWIEYKDDHVCLLSNGMTVFKGDVEKALDDLKRDTGVHVVDERAVKRPVCMWEKITATDILEGPTELPTSYVPIFPVVGKELIVDGKVTYQSAIRNAKDAQKAYNYWKTAATETVALAPRVPWILTGDQIEGYENQWENANRQNLPYLTYRYVEGQPVPQRVFPSGVAAAELANAQSEHEVMQDIIGLHEANLGEQGNEKSGKAIVARQNRGDLATFVFPDNLARSVEHLGRVLVEMIPQVYDTQRIVRIRMPDDSEDFVEINQSVIDEDSGEAVQFNDIGYGKYDVVIDTGPSYATQRQEGSESILALMERLSPEKVDLIAHKLVQKMDFPGADEVYALLRKLIPDNLKSQEEREADLPKGLELNEKGEVVDKETKQPPPPPPPTPEQQVEMTANKAKEAESSAKMETAKATTATAQAETAKADATKETAKATIAKARATMAEGQEGGAGDQIEQSILKEVEKLILDKLAEHELEVDDKITEAVVEVLKRVKGHMDGQEPAPAAEASPGVVVQVPKTALVTKLDFAKGSDGSIASVTPTYDEEGGGNKITSIKFHHGAKGLSEAVPEYEE